MLRLNDQHLAEIRAHGERDYPFECCGLLIGVFEAETAKLMNETYAISNAREEDAKRNRFLIRPEELMRGEKYARERGLDVIGFTTRILTTRRCLHNTIWSTPGLPTRTFLSR